MDFLISTATKADYSEISQVSINCWRDAYKDIFPQEFLINLSLEEKISSRRNFFDGNKKTTFIIKKQDKIIGFSDVGDSRRKEFAIGEIYSLYVLPEFKGQGLGKKLIEHSIKWLAENKMTPFMVTTLEKNVNAQKFYEKLGFVAISKIITQVGEEIYPEIVYLY